jgi:hypothetical protein
MVLVMEEEEEEGEKKEITIKMAIGRVPQILLSC